MPPPPPNCFCKPPSDFIIFAIPDGLANFFIILAICACCLINLLTSATSIPQPAAIRFLRLGFIKSGLRRSLMVIDWIIASIFLTCFSGLAWANASCRPALLMPGSLSRKPIMPPILFICSNCISISSKLKLPPFCSFFGFFFVDLALKFFDQRKDVTHTQNTLCDTFRMEWLQGIKLFAHTQEFDWLTGNGTHRQCRTTACITIGFGQDHTG